MSFAVSEHESTVRDRTNLINEEISVVFQVLGFLDANAKRKRISRWQRFSLGGAGDDDGRRMTRPVQGIGLNDQSRALPLSRLLFVSLRLKVNGPNLSAQSGAHTIPSEILDSIAAWAAALCAASCVERYAMRSCMRCWLNSSMARRTYSDLLKPARLASTAMLRAKSLGMRSEKVVNDSMAKLVLQSVLLSSITYSNTPTHTVRPC